MQFRGNFVCDVIIEKMIKLKFSEIYTYFSICLKPYFHFCFVLNNSKETEKIEYINKVNKCA